MDYGLWIMEDAHDANIILNTNSNTLLFHLKQSRNVY